MSMAARPPRKCTIVGDGMRDLGRLRWRTDARYCEVGDLDVAHVAQRPDHRQLGRRHVDRRRPSRSWTRCCPVTVDAVELLEEVEVEPGPAELAVGDAAHAERLEPRDGGGDGLVLHGSQLGRR